MWCSGWAFSCGILASFGEQNNQWAFSDSLINILISSFFCLCLCVHIRQMMSQLCSVQKITHWCCSGAQMAKLLPSINCRCCYKPFEGEGQVSTPSLLLERCRTQSVVIGKFPPIAKTVEDNPAGPSFAAQSHSGSTAHCLHSSADAIIYGIGLYIICTAGPQTVSLVPLGSQ